MLEKLSTLLLFYENRRNLISACSELHLILLEDEIKASNQINFSALQIFTFAEFNISFL